MGAVTPVTACYAALRKVAPYTVLNWRVTVTRNLLRVEETPPHVTRGVI